MDNRRASRMLIICHPVAGEKPWQTFGIRSTGISFVRRIHCWSYIPAPNLYLSRPLDLYCVKASLSPSPNLALCILISSTGLSLLSVLTASNLCTVFIPFDIRPNFVCLPSRNGVGACSSVSSLDRSSSDQTYTSDEELWSYSSALSSEYQSKLTIGIRPRISHGQYPRSYKSQIRMNLICKLVSINTSSSTPSSRGIASLYHESRYYTMEYHSVVISSFC